MEILRNFYWNQDFRVAQLLVHAPDTGKAALQVFALLMQVRRQQHNKGTPGADKDLVLCG